MASITLLTYVTFSAAHLCCAHSFFHSVLCLSLVFTFSCLCQDTSNAGIPGIGAASLKSIRAAGYETPLELIGEFFKKNRDQTLFQEKLEEIGVKSQYAKEAAEQIYRKLITI